MVPWGEERRGWGCNSKERRWGLSLESNEHRGLVLIPSKALSRTWSLEPLKGRTRGAKGPLWFGVPKGKGRELEFPRENLQFWELEGVLLGVFEDSRRERGLVPSRGGQWRAVQGGEQSQEFWEWSLWVRDHGLLKN